MNFFKSVFPDDPDPPRSEYPKNATGDGKQDGPDRNSDRINPNHNPSPDVSDPDVGGWSFGGLMKTLSAKSESVIETYRRDLQEFGSGLRKEIEVAQGSLGNVGNVIDDIGSTVLKGTTQIISQGKEAFLAVANESDSDIYNNSSNQQSLNSKPYSRIEAQVSAIQADPSTYSDEPEDLNDFVKWKSGFVLEDKSKEIQVFLEENDAMESIYRRLVPNNVSHETFWTRYFYRFYKLKQAEDARAQLVRRAISTEEEELSWDVDDDEEEHESKGVPGVEKKKEVAIDEMEKIAKDLGLQGGSSNLDDGVGMKVSNIEVVGESRGEPKVDKGDDLLQNKEQSNNDSEQIVREDFVQEPRARSTGVAMEKEGKSCDTDDASKGSLTELSGGKTSPLEGHTGVNKDEPVPDSYQEMASEKKAVTSESCNKDNDFSLVSGQPSVPQEEEDLGWDEIEDLSCIEEKKTTQSGSPKKPDLLKRLITADEEEDLSWDIEDDDDEPAKTSNK